MTIAQINCFMEVARCQSFSKAASHLYISQPAISKQVSLLEKSLGVTLFDRTFNAAQLTQVGKMFYEHFQKGSIEFHALMTEAKQITTGHAGNLRLGCLDGWDLSEFFPKMRAVLGDKYPHLQLDLNGYNHTSALDALLQDDIDMAITLSITLHGQPEFSYREFTSAQTVVLFSAHNPLAAKKELTLWDFRDEPFFVITPQPGAANPMEQLTIEVCEAAGFTPKIERTSSSASVLLRLQGGTGAQITSEWTGACKLPIYRMLPLNHNLGISAVWLENQQNPAKHVFISELFSHYSDN